MSRCFMAIYRLSIFEHPEWDRRFAQETLDVSLFLTEAEKNFTQVKEAAGLDLGGSEGVDTFSIMASKFRVIKTAWDGINLSTAASLGMVPSDGLGDFPMDFTDDDWLRDLLAP